MQRALVFLVVLVMTAVLVAPVVAQDGCNVVSGSQVFTVRDGTLNDSNGLVCRNGEWVAVRTEQESDWEVTWLPGAELDRGDGTTFRDDAGDWIWREVAPELWPTFPNEPNPLVPEFRVVNNNEVPDGLENANQESNFCQQLAGESCRVPVAARHYFYFSGDYDIPNLGSCEEDGSSVGCMLVIVNVGEVTSDFTGVFQQGFRVHARYWNGETLDMAIWALTSHGVNTMMNMDSVLNPDGTANAGANCSVPTGCEGVHIRVLFVSGNEPLLMLENTFR